MRLISFETLPGTSNCCRMGREKAGKTRFDENAARLRLMKLRGDEGQRSSEMTRAAARSGHSPSLTQPDEPLGYVEAYCISVPVVMPVCVFLSWKECFPRMSEPEPQKNNTYYFKLDNMTVY